LKNFQVTFLLLMEHGCIVNINHRCSPEKNYGNKSVAKIQVFKHIVPIKQS